MKRKIVKLYRRMYPFLCMGCGKQSSTYHYMRLVEKICRLCRRNLFNPNQLSMFEPEPVVEVIGQPAKKSYKVGDTMIIKHSNGALVSPSAFKVIGPKKKKKRGGIKRKSR